MKLFEYWIELPKVLSKLFIEQDHSYDAHTSQIINVSNKIIATEKLINQSLKSDDVKNSLNYNNLKNTFYKRLVVAKKEKQLLAFNSIKNSVRIMNSLYKSYESIENYNKDNIGKLKIFLQLTRTIASKCDQEIHILNKNFNKTKSANININEDDDIQSTNLSRSLSDSKKDLNHYSIDINYEDINEDLNSDVSCCSDSELSETSQKSNKIDNKKHFILMIKTYVIKLQAKLYEKSTKVISLSNILNSVNSNKNFDSNMSLTCVADSSNCLKLTNEKRNKGSLSYYNKSPFSVFPIKYSSFNKFEKQPNREKISNGIELVE